MINLKKIFIENWHKKRLAPFYILKNSDGKGDFILDVLSSIINEELNVPLATAASKISENGIPDIFYLAANEGDKLTSETTEQIFEFTNLRNFQLKYKVIIVENAHLLNLVSSNKLLKILEEPNASTLFIFLVSKNRSLLKTIESRAVTLTLNDSKSVKTTSPDFLKVVSDFETKKIGEAALIEELKKIPNADSLLMQRVLESALATPDYAKLDKIIHECQSFETSAKYLNSVAERLYSLCQYL